MKAKIFLRLGLVVICVIAAVLASHLFASLPPPKIEIRFIGFTTNGTNVLALMCITNVGRTKILWHPSDGWEVHTEIEHGGNTNYPNETIINGIKGRVIYSGWPATINPSSGMDFLVSIPENTESWQVIAGYGFNKRRNSRMELFEWCQRHNVATTKLNWLFRILPPPPSNFSAHVSSPLLTNKPPSGKVKQP